MDIYDLGAVLIYIIIIVLGVIIGGSYVIYYHPLYSDVQPSNYFTDLDWNSSIDMQDYDIYVMANTSSMLPTIPFGAMMLVIEDYNISLGDIIVVKFDNVVEKKYQGMVSAHRVIEIEEGNNGTCYFTKGDNVRYSDNKCFLKNETYGKVVGILF